MSRMLGEGLGFRVGIPCIEHIALHRYHEHDRIRSRKPRIWNNPASSNSLLWILFPLTYPTRNSDIGGTAIEWRYCFQTLNDLECYLTLLCRPGTPQYAGARARAEPATAAPPPLGADANAAPSS